MIGAGGYSPMTSGALRPAVAGAKPEIVGCAAALDRQHDHAAREGIDAKLVIEGGREIGQFRAGQRIAPLDHAPVGLGIGRRDADRHVELDAATVADHGEGVAVGLQVDRAGSGEADLVFGDGVTLSFWLAAPASEQCCRFVSGLYMSSTHLGHGMVAVTRAQDQPLLDAVNAALRAVEQNGVYAEIFARYFPIDPFGS